MEYHYNIEQFNWNKDTNTFYGDSPEGGNWGNRSRKGKNY